MNFQECPRLILAPFSMPPLVVFEDVLIGSSCEKSLEIFNPSKQTRQISLSRSLPPGVVINLPSERFYLAPETCSCLTIIWTPLKPIDTRETIRFTNEDRGRYDVRVVLKSVMNDKGKISHPKGLEISLGKIKKKATKKSAVGVNKRIAEDIYNSNKVKTTVNVIESTQHRTFKLPDKENISIPQQSVDAFPEKYPFESLTSFQLNFDTSEIFSNIRKTNNEILQNTYDKKFDPRNNQTFQTSPQQNILKSSNKQSVNTSGTDIFDNLTFTPLKTLQGENSKDDKLEKSPKIILSLNSDTDLHDSLDIKNSKKENETQSIICVTSSQPPNKWLTVNHSQHDNQIMEIPTMQNKKIPNTSSPKEFNSANFSFNTDLSRISDVSCFPHRFSIERKILPKMYNETYELINETNPNIKLSSDTYAKDSPNAIAEHHSEMRIFNRDHYSKLCRQSLFSVNPQNKELFERNYLNCDQNMMWHNDLRGDRSPLRSPPEESGQSSSGTKNLDKTERQMNTFTINRTYDKTMDKSSSCALRQKSPKKVPTKKSLNSKGASKSKYSMPGKVVNTTYEANESVNQNILFNQVGNVYSQSHTVVPFLSSTYFHDEVVVDKFEQEFKKWLNYILTPPVDLDSNVEQKIRVGKALIENRNKEIPAAPTNEQVSSVFHNSHRLESLRRSAKGLLLSPKISQVLEKLNVQIEKKLIAIRNDRNLHLNVGLQKIIMELLLSYNPLWLRIGLETIYGLVLPLKSNSDIMGLTNFIIQRMFKNPHLKNKHSKSSAPNMLLPAYIEAIKKFTLKKFFMLVFFLDQAKQKKLISHDPCLFCRNAVCKESREVIIRFTRELIAGIGDITKHLRSLGYVVTHKQSFLDEYKYAVHNIAADISDGVRLTKVMEIILLKSGLLHQLRTPAISRPQKIHNVQVALNALKEANFVIVGDITATDIADGHREKTLSLLWQLIHVFRAPLFVKAANVIQTWWRKKYAAIIECKRREAELRERLDNAASVIQIWWRKIQYDRRTVEVKMQQLTSASVIIQKNYRRWSCHNRFLKMKTMVVVIENWYYGVKKVREARELLKQLRLRREEQRHKAIIKLQACARRWILMRRYRTLIKKVVLIQSAVRCFLLRKQYLRLKKSVSYVQEIYRGKLLMKKQMKSYATKVKNIIFIQSYFRMVKQRRLFISTKNAVIIIEERYRAVMEMRRERNNYLLLKWAAVKIQAVYRGNKCRSEYQRQIKLIINAQRRIRATMVMLQIRRDYLKIRSATITIQRYVRAYLSTKKARAAYLQQQVSAILIQKYFRSYQIAKAERIKYLCIRNATIKLQVHYRSLLQMRQVRNVFVQLKNAAIVLQRRYRAITAMRSCKSTYQSIRTAAINIQRRYRAQIRMRDERMKYLKVRNSCIAIQNAFRAYLAGKQQRQAYLRLRESAIKIQNWFRSCKKGIEARQQYIETKQACMLIQKKYKARIIGRTVRQEFIRIKTATIFIQKYYRNYIVTKSVRKEFIILKTATITIQRFYRSYMETKKQKQSYIQIKTAAIQIQHYYRRYKETHRIKLEYIKLRTATIQCQRRYRALLAMRVERQGYLKLKMSVIVIQKQYRALIAMRSQRSSYLELRSAVVNIQRRFKAQIAMKKQRKNYLSIIEAFKIIQQKYRAYLIGKKQRNDFMKLKTASVQIQQKYRALLTMRRCRAEYLTLRSCTILIQRKFRANKLMLVERSRYRNILKAVIIIQRKYRAYVLGNKIREYFLKMKFATIVIQTYYRSYTEKKKIVKLQALARGYLVRKQVEMQKGTLKTLKEELRRNWAASKIQALFRGHHARVHNKDHSVKELRRRWRDGALESTQPSLKERINNAIYVLRTSDDIRVAIGAFRTLQHTTEFLPMLFKNKTSSFIGFVYEHMGKTNRSAPCIELLKSAVSVLINLTRYKLTGPEIYQRERIPLVLKLMMRFSNSEAQLLCILCTYLWLFSKYNEIEQDLTEFLHIPENRRMLVTIKDQVDRMKRMAQNVTKNRKNQSITYNHMDHYKIKIVLPSLEPDYGFFIANKPRYFEDAQQAINCLFKTYKI